MTDPDVAVRQARSDDAAAVAAFTQDTWEEFDRGDYLPDVFPEWVESDGPDQRTFVAEVQDAVAGVCQCVRLSGHEAWAQGMRVAPAHRGTGVADALNEACFAWAKERGAAVCRAMVFSWNAQGLGAARNVGFAPATEFRWAHPEPDGDVSLEGDAQVAEDPTAAWSAWQGSGARDHLRGLGLDPMESWSLSEVTRERFEAAADERTVLAVQDDAGTRAATYRSRVSERESVGGEDGDESDTVTWAEYGVAAWADLSAGRALFGAVARDAADCGADRTRVLIPETVRHVSDVAALGVGVSDDPDFVLAADLTGTC